MSANVPKRLDPDKTYGSDASYGQATGKNVSQAGALWSAETENMKTGWSGKTKYTGKNQAGKESTP